MICIWSSWCHCHPVISCFIKIQIALTFLVPANQVVLEKRPLNGYLIIRLEIGCYHQCCNTDDRKGIQPVKTCTCCPKSSLSEETGGRLGLTGRMQTSLQSYYDVPGSAYSCGKQSCVCPCCAVSAGDETVDISAGAHPEAWGQRGDRVLVFSTCGTGNGSTAPSTCSSARGKEVRNVVVCFTVSCWHPSWSRGL